MEIPTKKLLTINSAATVLDRTPKAIRRMLDKRVLTAIRIDGRVQIDPIEIDALIARARAEALADLKQAA